MVHSEFMTVLRGIRVKSSGLVVALLVIDATLFSGVRVADAASTAPISITVGGTYSGDWNSDDPSVPAVSITTDQPVVLQNSTVSGPGDLIVVYGKSMANITVRNVTGTGRDPQVAGKARGAFLRAYSANSVVVQNCTITGTSLGILVGYGTTNTLRITNNKAYALEDRASDGNGGFQTTRPQFGHFVQLAKISAPNGAEIGWNELKQTIGSSSTEDAINIYLSQGGNGRPIWAHDNYLEGMSSTTTKMYTGTGLIADGDNTGNTAWILFQANEVVHTAGAGVAVANGHDVTSQNNRVVSCGIDAQGKTYTRTGEAAAIIWNYYKASNFYNNTINTTTGGMLSVNQSGAPMIGDVSAVTADATNTISNNNFTDPCMKNGALNLTAEDDERAYWSTKLQANSIVLGDQH